MNVEGQIEGGALQGYGFGMMERIQFKDGIAQNPNFDDYLIPTSLDAPGEMETIIVETHEPTGPFGACAQPDDACRFECDLRCRWRSASGSSRDTRGGASGDVWGKWHRLEFFLILSRRSGDG